MMVRRTLMRGLLVGRVPDDGCAEPVRLMPVQVGIMSRIEPTVEWVSEEDHAGFDRAPGMPLLGFFTGSVFSLGIWSVLGWVAWHFGG